MMLLVTSTLLRFEPPDGRQPAVDCYSRHIFSQATNVDTSQKLEISRKSFPYFPFLLTSPQNCRTYAHPPHFARSHRAGRLSGV